MAANLYQVLAAAQGEHKLGVFKRATTAVSAPWTEMNAAGSPDNTHQSGFFKAVNNGNKIGIMYLLDDMVSVRIVEFSTVTDTYSAPSPVLTIPLTTGSFCFYVKSNGDYVVIGTGIGIGGVTYYTAYSGGVWGPLNPIIVAPGTTLYGGVLDSTDKFWFMFTQVTTHLQIRSLDASFTVGASRTYTNNLDGAAGPPSVALKDDNTMAVGYIDTATLGAFTVTIVTNLKTAPIYTPDTVYIPAANEKLSYVALKFGLDGSLNAFFVRRNIVSSPVVNEVDQSVRGTGVWNPVGTYYNAVLLPPANGVAGASQVITDIEPNELSTGWSLGLTMKTVSGFNTGFFIDGCEVPPPPPPPPPPPGPGTGHQFCVTGPATSEDLYIVRDYKFTIEPMPADTVFFTPWSNMEWPWEKIGRALILDVDTGGVPAAVDVQIDGLSAQTLQVTTKSNDRKRTIALNSDLIGRMWRLGLTPGPLGKAQLFAAGLDHVREPAPVLFYDSNEQNFNWMGYKVLKQCWLSYAGASPITIQFITDGGLLFFSKTLPAHAGRTVERFFFPPSNAGMLNKSIKYRIRINADTEFKLYADSIIEFIQIGGEQRGSFVLTSVHPEQQLPVANPVLAMWNALSSVAAPSRSIST